MSKPHLRKLKQLGSLSVWEVDGLWVRHEGGLPDFNNFGAWPRFQSIPRNEFWLDRGQTEEYRFYLINLIAERKAIRQGQTPEQAQNVGEQAEAQARKQAAPSRPEDAVEQVHRRSLGRLPNGVEVWLVDGDKVRDWFFTDFVQGGHDLVYSWIPAKQIWIDDTVVEKERQLVLLHEAYERKLMEQGMPYEKAHERALKVEQKGYQKTAASPGLSRTYYHGTHTESGLDIGDDLDPTYGSFESCVWVTSDFKHAWEFAYASAAVNEEAEPIVYQVAIDPQAIILNLQTLLDDRELRTAKSQGYNAVLVQQGERGSPEMAILTRHTAKVAGVERGRKRQADATYDRAARQEANATFDTLLAYLKEQEKHKDWDEYLIPYEAVDGFYLPLYSATQVPAHYDLFVMFEPSDKAKYSGALGSAYLQGRGVTTIHLPCLLQAFDPTYLHTRCSSKRATFVHEYVHWLDLGRRTNVTRNTQPARRQEGLEAYVNSPPEFNAYFQEVAHELDELIQTYIDHSLGKQLRALLSNGVETFVSKAMSLLPDYMPSKLNPTYRRKFQRRLSQLYTEYMQQAQEADLL